MLILGIILQAIKSRILIRKSINPIVHNPIIFSVSNHENMDPMLLSCSSVTMISDNAFDSVPCNRPARSFSMFRLSILITSCAGWAFSAKSKSFNFSSSNSAINSKWAVCMVGDCLIHSPLVKLCSQANAFPLRFTKCDFQKHAE